MCILSSVVDKCLRLLGFESAAPCDTSCKLSYLPLVGGLRKPLHFAIVDELDYVLIDEGRNPLLISGEASKDAARNTVAAKVAELLMRGLYKIISDTHHLHLLKIERDKR
uniref:chloroplast protein-transporting ATPase n=1 Tax=Lactuca sativa TaxID=4236 RepID=A0A9R1V9M3_LACSA|nr:hypothetical protein LSAT_V11C600336080 [Lactuca sativa]